ncbi:MAG: metallophosphoesterase [Clostridiaceae bacterium]|nr:metallophosphoesterase [Clostridiaceae bacterium]
MLLGIISDTHKDITYIRKAMDKLKAMDLIIHLGDNVEDVKEIGRSFKGEIISVRGNCDFSNKIPSERILVLEGKKLLITHGHKYSVKDNLLKLHYRALELGVDLVLYGHTHVSKIDFEDGIFFVNPGSTTFPKNGLNSVASIVISEGKINPNIIKI